MLYQKGEKLEVLKETLKNLPKLSGLDESKFVMSEEELKEFKARIEDVLNNLNTALYNTLLHGIETENKKNIELACDNVITVLRRNYTQDLVNDFYKEKQVFYDFMFFELIDDLMERYREYRDSLITIQQAYTDLRREEKIFDFNEIECLIEDYYAIKRDFDRVYCDSTKTYLIHAIELIFKKISELVKEECQQKYLCTDVLPNKLRKLIYLLEKELALNLDSETSEE